MELPRFSSQATLPHLFAKTYSLEKINSLHGIKSKTVSFVNFTSGLFHYVISIMTKISRLTWNNNVSSSKNIFLTFWLNPLLRIQVWNTVLLQIYLKQRKWNIQKYLHIQCNVEDSKFMMEIARFNSGFGIRNCWCSKMLITIRRM